MPTPLSRPKRNLPSGLKKIFSWLSNLLITIKNRLKQIAQRIKNLFTIKATSKSAQSVSPKKTDPTKIYQKLTNYHPTKMTTSLKLSPFERESDLGVLPSLPSEGAHTGVAIKIPESTEKFFTPPKIEEVSKSATTRITQSLPKENALFKKHLDSGQAASNLLVKPPVFSFDVISTFLPAKQAGEALENYLKKELSAGSFYSYNLALQGILIQIQAVKEAETLISAHKSVVSAEIAQNLVKYLKAIESDFKEVNKKRFNPNARQDVGLAYSQCELRGLCNRVEALAELEEAMKKEAQGDLKAHSGAKEALKKELLKANFDLGSSKSSIRILIDDLKKDTKRPLSL